MSFDPMLVAGFPHRFLTSVSLFVYFGAGATLFLFADCIPFSMALAGGAFVVIMVALPFGIHHYLFWSFYAAGAATVEA